ncbi:regulatory protein RecX [Croceicoccus hydrothermalis]|uniref:regulatory protein RecX n=1 Tax=Croceicoccus hydrothermalis TaxID=2867964 RepID=UPI001EFBC470|nr:RecX family transcriptional regulator [Croceicoccus hydrothermalis]
MKDESARYPRQRQRARVPRPPSPLTNQRLNEMALAYVARFATTARKLHDYCRRKLRERGLAEGEETPDIDALVAKFVANGWVNDEEFARAKSGSLLRRGYGGRRVNAALDAAGVAAGDRAGIAPGEARAAALRMAEKKHFGPFARDGVPPADRAVREKQVAAMLRAGHSLDSARNLVDASDMDSARDWASALDDGVDGPVHSFED